MEEHSRRPSPTLPEGLAAAIEARLEGRPRKALQESARRLSESYRARKPTAFVIRDETDALAYALTRMPATYAVVANVLDRLRQEQPGFAPSNLLDVGCGLGAASYAGAEIWPDIAQVALLDHSRPFLSLAQALAAESGVAALKSARAIEADLVRLQATPETHDLVVAAYALTEIGDDALPALTETLWALTAGTLVIAEPGTPRDHARLMTIRAHLIRLGAIILAPCPHTNPCPVTPPDWCHFSARLPRSRAHRLLKGADAPFEDEKFSYLAVARGGNPAPARVIAPARAGKAGIALRLCAGDGINETFTLKRDKARFERIRKKDWGDPIDPPPEDWE